MGWVFGGNEFVVGGLVGSGGEAVAGEACPWIGKTTNVFIAI